MLSGIKCDRVPINLNHFTRDICHFWFSTLEQLRGSAAIQPRQVLIVV